MKFITTLTLGLLGALDEVNAADKCYALALSGGGAFGAYEAGVLYGLYHAIPDKT